MKRLIIDITSILYNYRLTTGIQRVERNILRYAHRQSREIFDIKFTIITKHGAILLDNYPDSGLTAYLFRVYVAILRLNHVQHLTYTCLPFDQTQKILAKHWNNFAKYPLFLFFSVLILIPVLFSYLFGAYCLHTRSLQGKEDDILFIPGTTWYLLNIIDTLSVLKSEGVRIVTLLHDILPVLHPQHFSNPENFAYKLPLTAKLSSLIITTSESTRRSIINFFAENEIGTRVVRFKPGYYSARQKDESTRQELLQLFSKRPVFIVVGTIEPRKNCGFILDTFVDLWDKSEWKATPALCFIGRYGWKQNTLRNRILSHPQFKKDLFWFQDLTDAELDYSYLHSTALIFSSSFEGFGLPIVEALSRGCSVLASDIPIFREVAGDHCLYFSLESTTQLARHISDLTESRKTSTDNSIPAFHWPTWSDSVVELIHIMDRI